MECKKHNMVLVREETTGEGKQYVYECTLCGHRIGENVKSEPSGYDLLMAEIRKTGDIMRVQREQRLQREQENQDEEEETTQENAEGTESD